MNNFPVPYSKYKRRRDHDDNDAKLEPAIARTKIDLPLLMQNLQQAIKSETPQLFSYYLHSQDYETLIACFCSEANQSFAEMMNYLLQEELWGYIDIIAFNLARSKLEEKKEDYNNTIHQAAMKQSYLRIFRAILVNTACANNENVIANEYLINYLRHYKINREIVMAVNNGSYITWKTTRAFIFEFNQTCEEVNVKRRLDLIYNELDKYFCDCEKKNDADFVSAKNANDFFQSSMFLSFTKGFGDLKDQLNAADFKNVLPAFNELKYRKLLQEHSDGLKKPANFFSAAPHDVIPEGIFEAYPKIKPILSASALLTDICDSKINCFNNDNYNRLLKHGIAMCWSAIQKKDLPIAQRTKLLARFTASLASAYKNINDYPKSAETILKNMLYYSMQSIKEAYLENYVSQVYEHIYNSMTIEDNLELCEQIASSAMFPTELLDKYKDSIEKNFKNSFFSKFITWEELCNYSKNTSINLVTNDALARSVNSYLLSFKPDIVSETSSQLQ